MRKVGAFEAKNKFGQLLVFLEVPHDPAHAALKSDMIIHRRKKAHQRRLGKFQSAR